MIVGFDDIPRNLIWYWSDLHYNCMHIVIKASYNIVNRQYNRATWSIQRARNDKHTVGRLKAHKVIHSKLSETARDIDIEGSMQLAISKPVNTAE